MKTKNDHPSTIAVWGEILLPVCLLLTLLGWPFFQGTQSTEQVFEGVFLLLIVVAAAASSTRRATFIAVVAFGMLSFALDTVSGDTRPAFEQLATVFDLLFSLTLVLVLIERIFGTTGEVGWRVVANALSVYLLIGLAFAAIYSLVGFADVSIDLGFSEGDPDLAAFATAYFSFVTMTTLGYGDIAPENARIASIAVVQVLIGQFYLAVIVARLVGLVVVKSRE